MADKIDFGHDVNGWWAYVSEDKDLVIGHDYGEMPYEVYRGNFKGVDTPHIFDIMRDDIEMFSKIIKYYDWNAIPFLRHVTFEGYTRAMSDVVKLLPMDIYADAVCDAIKHNDTDLNKVVLKIVENISNYYSLVHKE